MGEFVYAERLHGLRRFMAEHGADACLISSPANRFYFGGLTVKDNHGGLPMACLLVAERQQALVVGFLALEQAQREAEGWLIERFDQSPASTVAKLLSDYGSGKVLFEADATSVQFFDELRAIANCGFEPVVRLGSGQRSAKDAWEVAQVRQAAQLTDAAFADLLQHVRVGVKESELAWQTESFLRRQGATELAFEIGFGSGANSSLPHAVPGERVLAPGDACWIDFGVRHNGYCSDLTRSFAVGHASDRYRRVWDLVHEAQQVAIRGCRPGMSGREVDALARDHLQAAGYGEAFGHSLGHGVGVEIHELPRLSRVSDDVLTPGMVVTFEPGVYLPGWGGVRHEDLGLITEDGVELLSRAAKPIVVS